MTSIMFVYRGLCIRKVGNDFLSAKAVKAGNALAAFGV
jgi:hypothetical protein